MTREQLFLTMAQAIATEEGFFMTEKRLAELRAQGGHPPDWLPLAQRFCNPGNFRWWYDHPQVETSAGKYVNFLAWAKEHYPREADPERVRQYALKEGWRVLQRQIETNVRRGLTWLEFFAGKPNVYPGFSPSSDGNRPQEYAEHVLKFVLKKEPSKVGITIHRPIKEIIDA